ncbi:MAG: 23S rRNA (uracil(1939)-C(5))-methyltransferase RlmD [Litorilituus sp.]|nr:23S rRNA (uracil(1939)-C(5))-methyltransferase RlmD [Litorilituus sp.]
MANFFKASVKKSSPTQAKQRLTINIEKLDINGCGVGRYQNKPIFIEGSLPTEKVEALLIAQKNKFFQGKLVKINEESKDRALPLCKHFTLCGGCNIQHLDYPQQLSFKKTKVIELFSRSGIDTKIIEQLPWQPPIVGKPWHYRRKARIGVQFNKNAQPTIGFRQKATNQLVAIKSCPTLVEPLNNIFPILQTLITKLEVKKAIGHIEVIASKQQHSKDNLITLIVRQLRGLTEPDRLLWESFAQQYRWQLVFDFGKKAEEIACNGTVLTYTLVENITIQFTQHDFIQVNEHVNQAMVQQAMLWLALDKSDKVLDLFCGLGNFSLPIATKVKSVVGIEGVQAMVDKAAANAIENQLINCQFHQADLNSHWLELAWAKPHFTKAVLDPARAGAEHAVSQISQLGIHTILYISCNAATLARDSQLLIAQGYKITQIGLVDMFSQTKHVETMVLFTK